MRPPVGDRHRVAQQLDRILALAAAISSQLIYNLYIAVTVAPHISVPQFRQQFGFNGLAQVHLTPLFHMSFFYESTTPFAPV
jgi:hypothetical protein